MGFVFVSGNLALDYVGTLNERFSHRVENLNEPSDLARWLVAAGVLDRGPAVEHEEFRRAVELREAIFAVVARQIDGEQPASRPAERDLINAAAAAPPPVPEVDAAGVVRRRGDLAAGLSAVARDAVALFEREDDALLKWCADEHCTHPFLDRSRGHRRRWCGMAGCGDRAKAAAYRERRRTAQPAG